MKHKRPIRVQGWRLIFLWPVFFHALAGEALAQQHGRNTRIYRMPFEAAQSFCQDYLASNWGTQVYGMIDASSQMLLQSPEHQGAGRSTAYYWLQLNQRLWTGACVYVEAEGGWGDGLDRLVENYSVLNGNAGEVTQFYIPKAYLEQLLLERRLFINAGKLDVSDWFDVNDAAGSSDLQFLSSSLVYNRAIPFPEKGLGMSAGLAISDAFYLNAGVGDARAVTTHSSFDTLFDGDAAAFAISEAGWTPSLLGQPGHYRFILWNDQRSWPRWDQSGDQTAPPGVAISFDQRFEQGVTLFCRYGYEDPAVYQVEHFWSVGGQLSEFSSMRPDDVIGVGMAESILSRAYRDSTDPVSGPHETLYEAYYLFYLDEFVTFTPVAQLLCHPLADPDAGSIIACGARLVVGF